MSRAEVPLRLSRERPKPGPVDYAKELIVKYVILIHSNQAAWQALPRQESDRVLGDHFAMIDELTKSGELVSPVLGLASERTFIENRNGAPAITDGPFGEAKEQLAGVFQIDVDSRDRAIEIATPLAQYSVVELRPVMENAGTEM
jgi:hypothetical protein